MLAEPDIEQWAGPATPGLGDMLAQSGHPPVSRTPHHTTSPNESSFGHISSRRRPLLVVLQLRMLSLMPRYSVCGDSLAACSGLTVIHCLVSDTTNVVRRLFMLIFFL